MEEFKLCYIRYSNHNFQNNKQDYDGLSEMTSYNRCLYTGPEVGGYLWVI